MQWSPILFILMGQCSFFVCELYEYHFINESKTWSEAQSYCRKHYTDLATVSNVTDMNKFNGSQNQDGAWIGLHCIYTKSINTWWCSLPGEEGNNPENYVLMRDGEWFDFPCTHECKCICYNGTRTSGKSFSFINNKMTLPEAQNYCREHHTDLVCGVRQLQNEGLRTEAGSERNLWIGLFREVYKWLDGGNFSTSYCDLQLLKDKECRKMCAVKMLNGKWSFDECNKTKPFYCYDGGFFKCPNIAFFSMTDKVTLIKEAKTWKDALDYCRERHRDLVSITNLDQQKWVQEIAKNAVSSHVWLGLRYTCTMDLWFWVSDKLVCYENWDSGENTEACDMAAAMDKNNNKWFRKREHETFNFICAKY